jgi:hypothetical protein
MADKLLDKEETEKDKALKMAKAIHEDKCATINGRDYVITNINHIKRRKVFSYFTHIQGDLSRADMWFLDSSDYAEVEKVIMSVVTYDNEALSKRSNHWDEFPEDYILFIQTMLPVISYPFLKGLSGD